jgi:hypothetical protein
MVSASLKSLSDFRRNNTSAFECLAALFKIPKNIAIKEYSNALEILTPDREISREKVRQTSSMMQDIGKKDAVAVGPASLIGFSFLREARKNSNSRRGAIVGDHNVRLPAREAVTRRMANSGRS